jgi:pre-mRNA-processing factor SLU7
MASARSSRKEKLAFANLPANEDINPHIPSYISNAPWYLQQEKRNLQHQRLRPSDENYDGLDQWYARGEKVQAATKTFLSIEKALAQIVAR